MKTFARIILMLCAVVNGNAMAALASTYDGRVGGWYIPYEGRLAGFFLSEYIPDGGTAFPILGMSTDPTIIEPHHVPVPATVLSYQDVMAQDSSFSETEKIALARSGYAMSQWANSLFFNLTGSMPPTECVYGGVGVNGPYVLDGFCAQQFAMLNVYLWNFWSPGSVALEAPPLGGPDGGFGNILELYADYTSGAHDQFDWSMTMAIMQIPSTGDEFLIPLGASGIAPLLNGATLNTLATPIPAAGLLFSSGLFGLVFAARRCGAA